MDFMSQYKKDLVNHKNEENGIKGVKKIDVDKINGFSDTRNDNHNGNDRNHDDINHSHNCGGKVLQLFAVVVHLGMNKYVDI
jgi:hypothetical protein